MNAPTNSAKISQPAPADAAIETAPAADDKICWIEVRQFPYAPDQQVELLHLQAEAEALCFSCRRYSKNATLKPLSFARAAFPTANSRVAP